jgi:lysophospholipid acyltransferase (LPLAT)-like uncharacterized protein
MNEVGKTRTQYATTLSMTPRSLLRRTHLQSLLHSLLGWIVACVLRLLGATWRLRSEGDDPAAAGRAPNIGALWHRNFLIAAYVFRDLGYSVVVSRSRDGDLIDAVLRHLGFAESPRGSSSRSGAGALRTLVRQNRAGLTVSVLVDGPTGPARESKIGVISLSRLSQVPITPVSFSASPCYRFKSWDQTVFPLPFARVTCHYSPALSVPREAPLEREEELRRELDLRLNTATDQLDRSHDLSPHP